MKKVCFSKKKPYFCILKNIKQEIGRNLLLNRIKMTLAEHMLTDKQLAKMLGKDHVTISKRGTYTSQPTLEEMRIY